MLFRLTNIQYSLKEIDYYIAGIKERHLRINLGKNMIL